MRFFIGFIFSLICPVSIWANSLKNESEEITEFLSSYLVVVEPGSNISSSAGHAAIRMVCPEFNMDFCFNFISKEKGNVIFSYLMGTLKAGMVAIPTNDFVSHYKNENRGICQYKFNLPDSIKRELWRHLDEDVALGQIITFDPKGYNCTSRLQYILEETIDTRQEYPDIPELKEKTFHDVVTEYDAVNSWSTLAVMTTVGSEGDKIEPISNLIFIPEYLARALQHTTYKHKPILSEKVEWLVTNKSPQDKVFPSTMLVFIVLSIICLLSYRFAISLWLVLGLFVGYLCFVSLLPPMKWTWLILIFNPLLPCMLCFKINSKWIMGICVYTIILLLIFLLSPHTLICKEYILLSFAFLTKIIYNRFLNQKLNLKIMKQKLFFMHQRLLVCIAALILSANCLADPWYNVDIDTSSGNNSSSTSVSKPPVSSGANKIYSSKTGSISDSETVLSKNQTNKYIDSSTKDKKYNTTIYKCDLFNFSNQKEGKLTFAYNPITKKYYVTLQYSNKNYRKNIIDFKENSKGENSYIFILEDESNITVIKRISLYTIKLYYPEYQINETFNLMSSSTKDIDFIINDYLGVKEIEKLDPSLFRITNK